MILIDKKRFGLKSFKKFIAEANAVGAKFEEKTAEMVREWLKENGLQKKFEACRYQPLSEDGGSRNEDYSDIAVQNIRTGERFFIECKEFERSNVLNLQFDIGKDWLPVPVRGKDRKGLSESESERVAGLTSAIGSSRQYNEFIGFLAKRNRLLKNLKPADFWFDSENDDADRFLPALVKKYNALVKSGKTESDCKEFDVGCLRHSTKNILVCALCWRLSDPGRTWDICKVNVPDIGKLVRKHYSEGKAESARYVQFGDNCLFRTSEENPFGLSNVPLFPSEAEGEFSLKFTPRFGTGSIYVTPRSEITSEFDSPCSFINKKKWPCVA